MVRLIIKTICVILALTILGAGLCSGMADAQPELISHNSSGTVNRKLSVDPTGKSEGFSAVLYDNSSGLPTSEANAIAETSEGFIWIGSYSGLIRYDGNTFERMDSTGGLTSIKCLYVDSRDRLWIGTNDNGVVMMKNSEQRKWNKLSGMKSDHIRVITEGADGMIYIATDSGIAMIDDEYRLSFIEDERVADANMRNLRVGNDGILYATTDLGDLMTLRDGKVLSYLSTKDNPLEGAGSILPDPLAAGKIYQEAVDFGLYYVDAAHNFRMLEKIDIGPLKYILSMEYIDGKVWICAGNGIGVLEDGRFTLLENLPMNNNVGHVMTDYLGNLWFTSTRQGVMKVVPNQFTDLFMRFDLPETVVNSTCRCEDKLFIATDTGLIVLDENGPVSELPLTKAVTAGGTDLGAEDLITLLQGSRSIIRDSKDQLWFSLWRSHGLLRYAHGEVTAFTEEDGLLSNSIRSICEGSDGKILVALTGGVNIIQDDRVVAAYGAKDGILNTESLTVAEGENGDILLGSNGGGIYIMGPDGVRNINVEEGLPSDIVMRLKQDENHHVTWIVSSSAIAYIRLSGHEGGKIPIFQQF